MVETRVPENVTSTCNPFLISLPMTTVDGSEWLYDLVIYPKNQTGNPDLEKTVRESKSSTGKNNGSLTDITDGYAHTATASVGDIVDYQIISTLPTITSKASSLSEYTYVDTLSEGIKYNKNDVVIEFFRDSACTDKITTWDENSGKFTATYDDTANTMTIRMTETGLVEINEATSVYTDSVKRGYSDCTMRITYSATLAADEAKAAVHSAGKAVAGKYDEVKMNIELARLSDEQEDVFSDIGRMLFLMHTGAVKDTVMSDEGEKSPQQVIDALLVSAEQVQQEMDVITDKLTVCRNEKVCPCCGRICGEHDAFCAVCGTRLSEEEPKEEKAPAAEPEIQPAAADAPAAEPEAEAELPAE